jgi:pyruvate/2-oxoglutarate/acetoin dehydrogenase E1 component
MAHKTIAEAIRDGLREELRRDPNVILMGEDIGTTPGGWGGPFTVTLGLVEEFGPERVRNTPISEKGFVGAAVGAAMVGMRPVVEMQYADFIFCAMDEVVNQAAKNRYMSGGQVRVPMVIRLPSASSGRGAQHSQCPEAYFMHTPGINVITPSTAYDAKGLLKTAIRGEDPVVFIEHKRIYGSTGFRGVEGGANPTSEIPDEDYTVPFGLSKVKREGKDVTILANQLMLYRALEAADLLEKDGISCEVIDAMSLVPFDMDTLSSSIEKTSRLVIVEEDNLTGGWGAEVAARVADECLFLLEAPVKRVASYDVPMPASPVLESFVIPSKERIMDVVRDLMAN